MTRSLLFLLAVLLPSSATAPDPVDGVFGLSPAAATNSVAVEMEQPPGQVLTGVRWYHNDGTQTFPRLRLLEAAEGVAPDLQDTGLLLAELGGASLAWGDVTLPQPVTSTTGRIFAVLDFPAIDRTGEGAGGGPGIGYVQEESGLAPRAYVTPDGLAWIRVRGDTRIALEPVWSASKRDGVASLARLARSRSAGTAGPDPVLEPSTGPVLAVHPNPFNPRTSIQLRLDHGQPVRVEIVDVRGRRVATILRGQLPARVHTLVWGGRDRQGAQVASGVYVVRAEVGRTVHLQRVSLVR